MMATLANFNNLPELVRDSRLNATFRSHDSKQYTVHTREGHRSKQTKEVWAYVRDLGQGGQGSVELQIKQGQPKKSPAKYRAVKRIRIPESELASSPDRYIHEIEAIIKFSQIRYGELFVKTFGLYVDRSRLFIAREYCERGDLESYLHVKCPGKRLPEDQVQDIVSQMVDALSRMHEVQFAHRDLKPANVLIQSHHPDPWVIKLGDFGISRRGHDIAETTAARGTPRFMAPELLGFGDGNTRSVNLYAVDMWCLGETIFSMLAGRPTFHNTAEISRFCLGQLDFPAQTLQELKISEHAIDFVRSLMVSNPEKRVTAPTAAIHPWMTIGTDVSGSESGGPSRPWSIVEDASGANVALHSDAGLSTQATASWPTQLMNNLLTVIEGVAVNSNQIQTTQPTASWTSALAQETEILQHHEVTTGLSDESQATPASESWTLSIAEETQTLPHCTVLSVQPDENQSIRASASWITAMGQDSDIDTPIYREISRQTLTTTARPASTDQALPTEHPT